MCVLVYAIRDAINQGRLGGEGQRKKEGNGNESKKQQRERARVALGCFVEMTSLSFLFFCWDIGLRMFLFFLLDVKRDKRNHPLQPIGRCHAPTALGDGGIWYIFVAAIQPKRQRVQEEGKKRKARKRPCPPSLSTTPPPRLSHPTCSRPLCEARRRHPPPRKRRHQTRAEPRTLFPPFPRPARPFTPVQDGPRTKRRGETRAPPFIILHHPPPSPTTQPRPRTTLSLARLSACARSAPR